MHGRDENAASICGTARRALQWPRIMCDTLVIVGKERVLFAKNSDRDPNEAQFLEWHPRKRHAPGSTVQCTWIEIPQAAETHAVLLSRPFWMWGAEMGANEHGVVIGNEAVFTRRRYAKTGLTGMDLLRLALERASSAEQACEVIMDLVEAHGQGGGCGHENRAFTYHNSFIVADAAEAFVLETAGPWWAVEAVEGARTISNGLTIPSFCAEHSDWLKTSVSACRKREARTAKLIDGVENVGGLFAALRDHGEGCPYPNYSWINGAMAAPCMHAGGIATAAQTTASWVADLRPDGARHWVTATAAPCTSIFKPVGIERPLSLGPPPTDQADDSLWWRHERFQRAVTANPERLLPLFKEDRDTIEAAWIEDPPDSIEAFAEHDRLLAEWMKRVNREPIRDRRPFYVRRYWALRNERAKLQR